MKSRSYRRSQRERLAAKRKKRPGWVFHPKHIDTATPCSCDMCRSPRRSRYFKGKGKLTSQERKILEAEPDERAGTDSNPD